MARPLSRNQQPENAAFLRALRRVGNARLAARMTGLKYGTMQHRRRRHPAFAARWDAALATAWARLHSTGAQGPRAAAGDDTEPAALRTRGGESVVVRLKDGRCQVRSAQPGKLTQACEQAFLAALSATANVRLSAAAAGASVAAFHRRRRQNPAFARETRLALAQGYERVELALLASMEIEGHEHDAWRHNDPPDMPRMTIDQALQLMYLHQKEVRLQAEPPHIQRGKARRPKRGRIA